MEYYLETATKVLKELKSSEEGLESKEAEACWREERYFI